MRIRVYMPAFADHGRIDDDGFVDLPDGTTLDGLLKALKVPLRFAAASLCAVNYEKVPRSRALRDGDTVSFISFLAGG